MKLTVRPLPYSDESTVGYLHRLIMRNGVSRVDYLVGAANDSFYSSEGTWLTLLESLTGHPLSEMDSLPLRKVGVGAASKYFLDGVPLHRKHVVKALHICPECLREQPFHRASWQLVWMPLCEVHNRPLISCGPTVDSALLIKALKGECIWPRRRWTDNLPAAQLQQIRDTQRSLREGLVSWDQNCGFYYHQALNYVDRLIDRMHAANNKGRTGAPIQRSAESPERIIECMLESPS